MPADAVLRLVRIMQANPRLGMFQGLIVGLPSAAALPRCPRFNGPCERSRSDALELRPKPDEIRKISRQ